VQIFIRWKKELIMPLFLRFLRPWVLALLASLTLTACGSTPVVRTYEGDVRDVSEVARVLKADDLEIVEIDGKAQKSYLLDNDAMEYELLPGAHTVVFRYSKLWALPGNKDIGEKRAEEIESELLAVTFEAKPGETYHFDVPQLNARETVEQFAREPELRLLNETGHTVAQSALWKGNDAAPVDAVVSAAASSESGVSSVESPASATPGAELPPLEALKILWGQASAEEKKEFLRWAFQ